MRSAEGSSLSDLLSSTLRDPAPCSLLKKPVAGVMLRKLPCVVRVTKRRSSSRFQTKSPKDAHAHQSLSHTRQSRGRMEGGRDSQRKKKMAVKAEMCHVDCEEVIAGRSHKRPGGLLARKGHAPSRVFFRVFLLRL